MTSADVRDYLQTLPTSERKRVSTELYRAKLAIDLQKSGNIQQQFSKKMH
jgi:hypothetical protein